MATQGELFTRGTAQRSGQRSDGPQAVPEPAPVWLQRLSLIVLVLFCFYIGGLLTVLPWTPNYWEHNGWLMAHPSINAVLQQGWVRGVISGRNRLKIFCAPSTLAWKSHRSVPL